ncbi:MAG: EamA family transporter [Ignavibacterium sp.]|nr:EamA family transporter [Ignavibacterium sp.]
MIYLVLTIICSSSIALILKYGNVKKSNTLVLINANYITASLFSLIYIIIQGEVYISLSAFLFALFLGYLFAETFLIYSKAVGFAGTALATVSARLSVLIPVIFSILFFNESPDLKMISGFIVALITFYFFYLSLKKNNVNGKDKRAYLYLVLLFVGIGFVDFSMKIFERNFSSNEKATFVFTIFFTAFLYTLFRIIIQKIKYEKETFRAGLILGLPNVLAIQFLLAALSSLPAIVVFPTLNIGVIVLTALTAFIIFREKLNKFGIIALVTGVISIILLKL